MIGWLRRSHARTAPTVAAARPTAPPFPSAVARSAARENGPGDAFTPTRPRTGRLRLIGRERELGRILQCLNEDRAHVVLYSERGRGKTSLANKAVEALRRSGIVVARHTCEAGTTFDSLIRGLVRDLPASLLAIRAAPSAHDLALEGCAAALPSQQLRPSDVIALPQRLDCRSLVCVVDEFDRVADAATRIQLADLIKQLSDRATPLLFLIVGVSDNLDQILGHHPSIQRTVTGVHLPLFTEHNIAALFAEATRELGIRFPLEAVARIAVLSRGMPYMVQLLGLRLTQAARARNATTILDVDFRHALTRIVDDTSPRILALYADLTAHGRDGEMATALHQIALAPQDHWGRLFVLPTDDGGVSIGGRTLSPTYWRRLQAAGLLEPAATGSDLFVFAERGLMHHTLLLAGLSAQRATREPADPDAGALVVQRRPGPPPHLAALTAQTAPGSY